MKFDYTIKPGDKLIERKYTKENAVFSIVFPIADYNDSVERGIISILNQTYPYFELIIVGKNKINIKDSRIKLVSEEFTNILDGYNIGYENSDSKSEYVVFFREGELLEKTYLETNYLSLKTQPSYSWSYTNSIIYGEDKKDNFLSNDFFNIQEINASQLFVVSKVVFEEYGKFESTDNYSLGLSSFFKKLVCNYLFPIHISWYLSWDSYSNYIEYKNSKSRIKKVVIKYSSDLDKNKPLQYPFFNYNYEKIDGDIQNVVTPVRKDSKKINILMIVPWIIVGGADIFNLEFIKRLDKDKFSVTLICTEPYLHNLRQNFEELCDVYDITTFIEAKDYIPFIKYLIKKNNINMIFNTSSLYGYSILPYLKATYPEMPIVDYIHMEEWYNRNGGYSRSSTMVESIIDQTWVCNSVTEEIMKDYFKRKKEEVETIYIGVNEKRFNPSDYNREELMEKYDIPQDKKIIGYICRISEQKRPLLLADIIDKTLEKRDDVLFLIVGDGSMLDVLHSRVAKYKNNVKFLPSTSETPEMYRLCDITINCSIKEGLALTAYESLSMGVPVISADVGGQRELVGDDVGKLVNCFQDEKEILNFVYTDEEINGYVVAIDEVVANLDKLKKNCRKKILNKFTLDQMGENMNREFIRVFNNPKKDKIDNGKKLADSIGITKQLIISSLMEDSNKTRYQCLDFFEKVYKSTAKDYKVPKNRKEKIKNMLWKSRVWRWFTRSKMWKLLKKLIKRGN